MASQRSNGVKPGVVELDREQLIRLFDTEAREGLGISGKMALRRIRRGRTGDNYVWSDLRLLASLLPQE